MRIVIVSAALLLGAGIGSFEAWFAPSADLWPRWLRADPSSAATIDHSAWDGILASYRSVDDGGVARFAYGEVSAADRQTLGGYIDALAATPISRYARPEQLAYWVNLYNALTVDTVLSHYPVASIRDIDISPGLFADGPWDKKLVAVEGEALSLNDIEHRILRPIWKDPRIHYAVNCAAVGCPNLRSRAFTARNAEAMLEQGARDFINDPRGVRIASGGVAVSSIYAWFPEDFGGNDEGILTHLRRHAAPELAARLAGHSAIAGHRYDWSLNDSRR